MEKQPRQLILLQVPEPPHQAAHLLARQLQQQEADYHEGLWEYINQEQAKAYQLPLWQALAGLCLLDEVKT